MLTRQRAMKWASFMMRERSNLADMAGLPVGKPGAFAETAVSVAASVAFSLASIAFMTHNASEVNRTDAK